MPPDLQWPCPFLSLETWPLGEAQLQLFCVPISSRETVGPGPQRKPGSSEGPKPQRVTSVCRSQVLSPLASTYRALGGSERPKQAETGLKGHNLGEEQQGDRK